MRESRRTMLLAGTRELLAVLSAGLLGALAWEILGQEAFKVGYSVQNVNDAMGQFFASADEEVRRRGVMATVVAGVLVAAVHAAVRLVWRANWWRRALATGAALYLLWAFVFSPLVDRATDEFPAGLGASETDLGTHLSMLVTAFVTAFVISRVHDLMRTAGWYEVKHYDIRESVAAVFGDDPDGGPDSKPASRPGD